MGSPINAYQDKKTNKIASETTICEMNEVGRDKLRKAFSLSLRNKPKTIHWWMVFKRTKNGKKIKETKSTARRWNGDSKREERWAGCQHESGV